MLEDKLKIIDQITTRHPASGVDKGWSWYVGGMRDTGDWYVRKMLDVPIEELQAFLDGIVAEENKPEIPLTEQELADSKIIIHYRGGWTSKYLQDSLKRYAEELERTLLFKTPDRKNEQ